jgi:riboflavin kinase / FMN adenylyltransferase
MTVHTDINHLPHFKNAAITIGTFDGVHSGHLQIINQLKKEAEINNGETVIITFDPHPRMVLQQQKGSTPVKLLNTLPEKIELLEKQGIDHLVVVPFTSDFSNQTADEYIKDFLVSRFHPKTIIIGYDHRFGKNRSGDYTLLEKYQGEFGYQVKEIPVHVIQHVTISSTKIREALLEGDIETATKCLGYDYFFEGRIIDGNKLGRTLGYPTANLHISDPYKLIPANGIYAIRATISPEESDNSINCVTYYEGMMSIGIRPTIGGKKVVIEVNLFNFNQDIYNRNMRVYVKKFLRNEVKFDSLDELKVAMAHDRTEAENFLRTSL